MKEIDLNTKLSEKQSLEIVEQDKKQVEYQFIGSILPKKGHTLFEINTKTKEIKKAEYKLNDTYVLGDSLQEKKEVIVNPDCVYVSSLNKENAMDRYKKGKGSSLISHKKNKL